MKVLVLLILSVIVIVQAFPQKEVPEIVLYETDGDDNSYNFQFETSDGIARVEKGELKESSVPGEQQLSVEGSYVYSDDQGKEHRVRYIADERGYRVLPNKS
ncbi:unnamed protein product [Hermetia illucens]|uniref:Uncharacterized protein n=1 Tax=Hermetia illucens TaxID=343691 RepID=A0A7R8UM26_HERIL|nr:endocuticle structural glycoprotein ABD-5-like [Hermetia illucens]CAD7083185.1 unnamed protein product [Hermetia illucens]